MMHYWEMYKCTKWCGSIPLVHLVPSNFRILGIFSCSWLWFDFPGVWVEFGQWSFTVCLPTPLWWSVQFLGTNHGDLGRILVILVLAPPACFSFSSAQFLCSSKCRSLFVVCPPRVHLLVWFVEHQVSSEASRWQATQSRAPSVSSWLAVRSDLIQCICFSSTDHLQEDQRQVQSMNVICLSKSWVVTLKLQEPNHYLFF
jgi:hypothetical protein